MTTTAAMKNLYKKLRPRLHPSLLSRKISRYFRMCHPFLWVYTHQKDWHKLDTTSRLFQPHRQLRSLVPYQLCRKLRHPRLLRQLELNLLELVLHQLLRPTFLQLNQPFTILLHQFLDILR